MAGSVQDEAVGLDPFDQESVTVADSAVGLTAATYLDARNAEITLETAEIRMWVSGTDPTASDGHLVGVGDIIVLDSSAMIAGFRAIRTGAVSGVLRASYFK